MNWSAEEMFMALHLREAKRPPMAEIALRPVSEVIQPRKEPCNAP